MRNDPVFDLSPPPPFLEDNLCLTKKSDNIMGAALYVPCLFVYTLSSVLSPGGNSDMLIKRESDLQVYIVVVACCHI